VASAENAQGPGFHPWHCKKQHKNPCETQMQLGVPFYFSIPQPGNPMCFSKTCFQKTWAVFWGREQVLVSLTGSPKLGVSEGFSRDLTDSCPQSIFDLEGPEPMLFNIYHKPSGEDQAQSPSKPQI
jgi:hypothetical protein